MPFDIVSFLIEHSGLLTAISIASLLALLGSVLATPWLVARLPAGYFRHEVSRLRDRHGLGLLGAVAGNLFGIIMMLLGLLMMVTPGPGIVALLLGLSLCRFPGKHRLLQHLAAHPSVFSALNWMRKRHGRPPFEHPFKA